MKQELLFEQTSPLQEVTTIAHRICAHLSSPFVLWLKAPVGGGKTTLTGSILHELGLHSRVPVTSPTFSYCQEYEIDNRMYAHMDFYRVEAGFNPNDLNLFDEKDYFGLFCEWPANISKDYKQLMPTHIVEINYPPLDSSESSHRKYSFYQSYDS